MWVINIAHLQPIVFVGEHGCGFERARFFHRHKRIRHNNHDVTYANLARRRTVEANHARVALAYNDVGFEPFAIIIVHDLHALAFHQVRCLDKGFVDSDAAHIIKVGLRDADAVDFGFEYL